MSYNGSNRFPLRALWCGLINLLIVFFFIDWGLTLFSTIFQSYHGGQFIHLLICFLAFSHQFSTQYSFMGTCSFSPCTVSPLVLCQTSERLLTELGFDLTSPWLIARVATDWATGVRHPVLQGCMDYNTTGSSFLWCIILVVLKQLKILNITLHKTP